MKVRMPLVLAAVVGIPLLGALARVLTPQPNAAMLQSANRFLGTLTTEQKAKAVFQFSDAERLNWHFIPRERRGLPFKEMTEPQRAAARQVLQAGLSQPGYLKANTIMELELVLRELGGDPNVRDPERYFFSIFGTPSATTPWGWRMEGHHISLNFTIAGDTMVATAPSFLGANPAHVRSGSRQGLRALAAEEDLGRALISALDASQRAVAIITAEAPRDIVTGNAAKVDPISPAGIPISRLNTQQSGMLVRLIDEYLSRMAPAIAAQRRARLQQTDFDKVTFAWAGPIEVGKPHYYRVQGPSFLIEYDNTQNEANHIHSVWRDFNGDFGRDLIREHYQSGVHPH